jgi:hypothetical protein
MKIHLLLLSVSVLLLNGCCHPEGAYVPKNTDRYDLENHDPVALMSARVQDSVTVSELIQNVTPDGRMKVQANVRNRLERPIKLQISCVFKTPDGFSTGDETPWESLLLTENAQETVSYTAMNKAATRFTIRIREAR